MDSPERDSSVKSPASNDPNQQVVCPSCGARYSSATISCPYDGTKLSQGYAVGSTLADKYEFVSEIGSGGVGVIYKARQTFLKKFVAVKMLHAHRMTDEDWRRFQQEAKAISSLEHPNIIMLHDFGITSAGQPYMVIDFVDGETLADVLSRRGSLPMEEALSTLVQICEGLAHAHSKGILHRDLKPSNIMLSPSIDGGLRVKIVDFGMAKLNDASGSSNKLTQTGEVFGSPAYMSPEQCLGRKVDNRSDIYSFGCLMFETLTGTPPIQGESIVDMVYKQVNETPPTLREASLGKKFSPRLEEIAKKILAKEPHERYQTFEELKDDLVNYRATPLPLLPNKGKAGTVYGIDTQTMEKFLPLLVITLLLITAGSLGSMGYMVFFNKQAPHGAAAPVEEKKHPEQMSLQEPQELIDPDMLFAEKLKKEPNSKIFIAKHMVVSANALTPLRHNQIIEELDLSDNSIDDSAIDNFVHLPLKILRLSRTEIGITTLKRFPEIKSLEAVSINGCPEADEKLFDVFTKLPHLQELDIGNTSANDDTLGEIRKIKTLRKLSLEGCRHIDDFGILKLISVPLSTLNLSSMRNISNSVGDGLAQMSSLRELSLSGDVKLTDDVLPALSKMHLKELDLTRTRVTDAGLVKNLKACKSLKKLYLSRNSFISAAGLVALQTSLKNCEIDVGERTDRFSF